MSETPHCGQVNVGFAEANLTDKMLVETGAACSVLIL